jgi:hypothetical protein
MKKIITLIFILTIAFGSKNMLAQSGCPGVLVQKIIFSYDPAGNRIKRYIDCRDAIETPDNSGGGNSGRYAQKPKQEETNQAEATIDLTQANAKLYPNPAKEFVIVNFTRGEEKAEAKLFIYDVQGKAVGEQKLENGINTIIVNQLKPANYLFRVVCGNYNEDWQVVKQN